MASGNGGQIGFAKVGSLYSNTQTVNVWGNFVSETLEHKLAELKEASINGRRDEPPSYQGVTEGTGGFKCEPNPNFIGQMLTAWYGSQNYVSSTWCAAGSTGANSGPYAGQQVNWHQWTPSQNPWSQDTYLEPYNVMMYRDTGSAFLFQGAIFPQIKIDIQAGKIVSLEATVMARQVNLIQRTAAIQSLVSSGGRPWVWDAASVELSTDTTTANLAAYTNMEQMTITMDLPHQGVSLLDGTKFYGEFQPSNFRTMKIDGTMSFRNLTDYITFKNYNLIRLRTTLITVNSLLLLGNVASADNTQFEGYFGLRLHVPGMLFTSWSAPITGPNRITAKFAARATYLDTAGFSSLVELMNVVGSAQYTTIY